MEFLLEVAVLSCFCFVAPQPAAHGSRSNLAGCGADENAELRSGGPAALLCASMPAA